MNKSEYILSDDIDIDLDKINIPNLTLDEKEVIHFHVEITRHIQEINQLFRIFRCNFEMMLYHYDFMTNDTVIRKQTYLSEESDYIVVNTLVTNFLSSARTLIESIESFVKMNFEQSLLVSKNFKTDVINKIYDENFSYRFLIKLRDFSQHGHLPINLSLDGKYCFDLIQILSTPHFNHKKGIKTEIIKLIDEIYEKAKDYPQITFTLSLAEFNFYVTKIYTDFLNELTGLLQDSVNSINYLVEKYPDLINSEISDNLIIYDIVDDSLHCFPFSDDSIGMLRRFQKHAIKILEKENVELGEMRNNMTFRPL